MILWEIKNPEIIAIIHEAKHGSMTIVCDLGDAIRDSNNDEELIDNWQSVLEDLKNEAEHYWSELEKIKNEKMKG